MCEDIEVELMDERVHTVEICQMFPNHPIEVTCPPAG